MILYGFLLSQIYAYFVLPKEEGQPPRIQPTLYPILYKGMVIIPYSKNKAIHVHHWIIYFIVCLFNIPDFFRAFFFGLYFQGLLYDDCIEFIRENPYFVKND